MIPKNIMFDGKYWVVRWIEKNNCVYSIIDTEYHTKAFDTIQEAVKFEFNRRNNE